MVRSTIAFAVVAFGAAAVIAQAPDFSEFEARDYEIIDSRGFEDMVEIEGRQPEFFDHIEAREYEADQVLARDFDESLEARDATLAAVGQNPMPMNPSYPPPEVLAAAPGPTPTPIGANLAAAPPSPTPIPAGGNSPSQTVTITQTPTPTPCTKREAKRQKEMAKIKEAVAIVRAANTEGPLSKEQKKQVKAAKKYLKKIRHRRVKAAKRTMKKCKGALKKAGLKVKECKRGADCEAAYLAQDLSPARCKAAFKYMKRVKAAKKAEKKSKHQKGAKKGKKDNHEPHPTNSQKTDSHKADGHKTDGHKSGQKKSAKPYSDLLPPTKTKKVGADGVTTVIIKAGPTCTATPDSQLKSSKRLVARDAEFEYVSNIARDFDFNDLD